jgi:hydroxymethylglutaryl-CoA reductase
MQTRFRIQLPSALAEEIMAAARAAHLPVEQYAAQVIEAFCAERRMERHDAERLKVKDSRPRMKTSVSGGDTHPPPSGVFVMDMTAAEAEEFLKAMGP